MAERKTFSVVNFRSVEHLLGQPPNQNYGLTDILLNFPEPFGISHAPSLRQGIEQYSMGLWDGDGEVVWMGVSQYANNLREKPEVGGLFYLERQKRRMLYDPGSEIPLRDSYRGFYRNDFGTTARLSDLVQLVLAEGIPMHQITSLFRIPGIKDFLDPLMMRPFSTALPHRLEGEISLEDIMQQKLYPIKPVTSQSEVDSIVNNHA